MILAFIFWEQERNFDSFHANRNNLFRITTTVTQNRDEEPKQLYRVLVKEYISKKGDKEKLLKFPYHQTSLVRIEEIEQMGHS